MKGREEVEGEMVGKDWKSSVADKRRGSSQLSRGKVAPSSETQQTAYLNPLSNLLFPSPQYFSSFSAKGQKKIFFDITRFSIGRIP